MKIEYKSMSIGVALGAVGVLFTLELNSFKPDIF